MEDVEIPGLEDSLRQQKLDYGQLQKESKRLVLDISNEKHRLLEENQRQGFILDDRIKEIESRSWLNEKLLMRVALLSMELERVHKSGPKSAV